MTASLDITKEQRKTLLAFLRRFIPGVEVWAYGSRVKWTSHPGSDLDLVVFTTPEQRRQFSDLKDALAESNLPFMVGVHVWSEEPERFQEIIRKKYVVLQEANKKRRSEKVPAEWKEIPFNEAVLLNPTTPLKTGSVYPFVDMQAISPGDRGVRCSEHREFTGGGSRFQNQDTLMARITPCLENGKIARFLAPDGEPIGHGSTEFIVVRGRPGVTDNDYAYYLTISPEVKNFAISQMTGSSGRQRVPTDSLGNIDVLLPPMDEQKGIAAILSTIDDKIELNRRMNETLESMARSLFKSWFVDATQAGLPEGWRYATIAELCDINSWTLGKCDECERIEYVEISEAMRGNIGKIQSYERGEEPSRARRRLRHGDTVLSTVRPDRGSYFLCLNPSPYLIASTGFAVLTPTKAPWSFIHAAMTQTDAFDYLGQHADGGAYPAVRPEMIGQLEVPWPNNPEVIRKFHSICAPLYERAECNRREARTLAALRDALLPKLLSGELLVPPT